MTHQDEDVTGKVFDQKGIMPHNRPGDFNEPVFQNPALAYMGLAENMQFPKQGFNVQLTGLFTIYTRIDDLVKFTVFGESTPTGDVIFGASFKGYTPEKAEETIKNYFPGAEYTRL